MGREAVLAGNFDAFIIAMRDNPKELIKLFLPLLGLSKPFVVFSPFREPLAECHVMLKSMGCAVLVKLTENWLREYQVLPDRTHPLVTMSGNSGFLLSGIKVQTSSECCQVPDKPSQENDVEMTGE
ncbi:unnamed protein product [Notodromas monacha]|uniref:tRNA (adenine(58)-N(1))-methyltransferase non-catalytic subunit TRM6 n=1 Tax=Notodromas monacha TaxID=399045 RepID=A0A7R9GK50_9CRUS|nr:unnamed protein product [Notodromas monacha]CAG0925649.1 unnamed protein product [Notodromas monacha]